MATRNEIPRRWSMVNAPDGSMSVHCLSLYTSAYCFSNGTVSTKAIMAWPVVLSSTGTCSGSLHVDEQYFDCQKP